MDKSARAEITLPSAERDLLMLAPSLSLSPVAPVLSALSLPDRKKKIINLPYKYSQTPPYEHLLNFDT